MRFLQYHHYHYLYLYLSLVVIVGLWMLFAGNTALAQMDFVWLSGPPTSSGVSEACPNAELWRLSYWSGPDVDIRYASGFCPGADRVWANRNGRWLAFNPGAPEASDTWTSQRGEATFLRGTGPARPDFNPVAKSWSRHGFSLAIDQSGYGRGSWRVYEWCTAGQQTPCDAFVGNWIINGGSAALRLARIEGNTAYGEILASNSPAVLAPGPFSIALLSYGMAELRQGDSTMVLCGPDFAQLAPESVRNQSPCGA